MSKVSALYHIVFCTKCREMTLREEVRDDLYRYIWGIIKNQNCRLLRMGGIENHIHMLIGLNPSIALSNFVRDIKSCTSSWMRQDPRFLYFKGWAKGYYARTISNTEISTVSSYIMNQRTHHHGISFDDELKDLYAHAQLEYDARDMME